MTVVLGIAGVVAAFIAAAAVSAMSKLAEEEIRGWLEVLPGIVLRMAARLLEASQRAAIYGDEWLPDLLYIARQADSRPVTRFIRSMRFSVSMLRGARREARARPVTRPAMSVVGGAINVIAVEGTLEERFATWLAARDIPADVTIATGNSLGFTDEDGRTVRLHATEPTTSHKLMLEYWRRRAESHRPPTETGKTDAT